MGSNNDIIDKLNLTNELLFRLCVGQRFLSKKDYIWFRSLIPQMTGHPCEVCKGNQFKNGVEPNCGLCKFIPDRAQVIGACH